MVRPNEEDPMDPKSDVYRTTVKKAVTGILNALHTDTPLDFNTIKAMHKDVPMGANFVNKVKQNDHTKDIFLTNYIIKIDEILQSLNMKLVPFYEPELVQRMDKRDPKNPQKIECTQLAGFFVRNEVVDRDCMSAAADKMLELAKDGQKETDDYRDQIDIIQDEIENMKLCGLLPEDDNQELNRLLVQMCLAFIFTRSYELGTDHGGFWNDENPATKSFVTLRDLYAHLSQNFGLSVPNDLDKEGGHDIRFHSGKKERGYIKKLITQNFAAHRWLKLQKSTTIRDGHLHDGDNEDGKIMVSWDARAIAEFDIEDILTGFSTFVCEDGYPGWRKDEGFMAAIGKWQDQCEVIREYHENDDAESVLQGWKGHKSKNRPNGNTRKKSKKRR